jgi:hypothetical protein
LHATFNRFLYLTNEGDKSMVHYRLVSLVIIQ